MNRCYTWQTWSTKWQIGSGFCHSTRCQNDWHWSNYSNTQWRRTPWCGACDAILGAVETQMGNANGEKERHLKHRFSIEEEVANIKKTLKTQVTVLILIFFNFSFILTHEWLLIQVQETEDMSLTAETREAMAHSDKGKKLAKGKGLRGSGPNKFWNKSWTKWEERRN